MPEKTTTRFAARYSTFPSSRLPARPESAASDGKTSTASLLSFSADAYLNEMGITNRLQPDEVTNLCNTASEPNDPPARTASRTSIVSPASSAPPKLRRADSTLAQTPKAS